MPTSNPWHPFPERAVTLEDFVTQQWFHPNPLQTRLLLIALAPLRARIEAYLARWTEADGDFREWRNRIYRFLVCGDPAVDRACKAAMGWRPWVPAGDDSWAEECPSVFRG